MKLSEIVCALSNIVVNIVNGSSEDVEISSIATHSSQVRKGTLFICRKGNRFDSHLIASEMIYRGAVALVTERPLKQLSNVPIIVVEDSKLAESIIASEFFGHPYRKLVTVGITGTNGKSTTARFIFEALRYFGVPASIVGTVQNIVGDEIFNSPVHTTPPAIELLGKMRKSLDHGDTHFIMEVSSHALKMKRVESVQFDVGVITNITRDHLELHGDFEDYRATKFHIADLLKDNGLMVVSRDHVELAPIKERGKPVITYGKKKDADVRISEMVTSREGSEFVVEAYGGRCAFRTKLIGFHNIYNLVAGITVLTTMDYKLEDLVEPVAVFEGVEGRFQLLHSVSQMLGFDVIVDFAHTPDALYRVIQSARAITSGRVIVVFGAGGESDPGKRPIMGRVVSRFADVTIVTTDDPKSEDPDEIIEQIVKGITEGAPHLVVPDRREAIEMALTIASKNDTVIIAGRGHEEYMVLKDRKIPFKDAEVVEEIARRLCRKH